MSSLRMSVWYLPLAKARWAWDGMLQWATFIFIIDSISVLTLLNQVGLSCFMTLSQFINCAV